MQIKIGVQFNCFFYRWQCEEACFGFILAGIQIRRWSVDLVDFKCKASLLSELVVSEGTVA